MIKAVLDTNVIVSALLSPDGPSSQVLNLVLLREVTPCLDNRICLEYRDVLHRVKFGFDASAVEDLLLFFDAEGEHTVSKPLGIQWEDPSDAKFLEVAAAAQAAYLITGNSKHYPAHVIKQLAIVSPARFLSVYK